MPGVGDSNVTPEANLRLQIEEETIEDVEVAGGEAVKD